MSDLNELIKSSPIQSDSLNSLLDIMKKSEDCPDDEDCDDVHCPDCGGTPLCSIFGTLPLKVKCSLCGGEFLLKDIVLI